MKKYNLEFCKQFAKNKGGECLSEEYKDCKNYMLWQCANNHSWKATFDGILNQKNWCPHCANNAKHTLKICQEFAIKNGGKCLSLTYKRAGRKMLWECSAAHKWETSFDHILNDNTWCPYCSNRVLKTKEQFILDANIIHNNKYDYSEFIYIGNKIPGIIICHKIGHGKFLQIPSDHLNGSGCSKCISSISNVSQMWLDKLGIPNDETHREVKLLKNRKFRVDGFNPETKTVYEFNGDSWHGNLSIFNPNDINPITKTTYGKLYQKTLEREQLLKEAGYTVISIWESDFKKILKENQ